jgi:hypothetical protein
MDMFQTEPIVELPSLLVGWWSSKWLTLTSGRQDFAAICFAEPKFDCGCLIGSTICSVELD